MVTNYHGYQLPTPWLPITYTIVTMVTNYIHHGYHGYQITLQLVTTSFFILTSFDYFIFSLFEKLMNPPSSLMAGLWLLPVSCICYLNVNRDGLGQIRVHIELRFQFGVCGFRLAHL